MKTSNSTMLTPEERRLVRRCVQIDGDGNVVGNDSTVRVVKQAAGDYVAQIGEQRISFTLRDLHQIHIAHSQVGVVGDHTTIYGGVHFHSEAEKRGGRRDFYRHIPLPPHYIERPEVIDAARAALLDGGNSMALTSAIQRAPEALHGMGGIGKTVVARALYEDAEVQEVFRDGILWATLGHEATDAFVSSKLREWIYALGGIVRVTAPTLDQLKVLLAQLLAERACLLIVDDVWRRTHAEAFQVGGPRCRLLLTTRDAEIARGLGARIHRVDVMAPDQAVTLLEQWARGRLEQTGEDLKNNVVARVGCLPLAVKLAGEQLCRHDPERWLNRFDAVQLRNNRPETIHDSLFQTFCLSLDDLSEQDRRCYTALAIFPEDEPIPLAALAQLWGELAGLDENGVSDLMHDLAARALVQLGKTRLGLMVRLHDLLRDFIVAELGEQGKRDAHRALLHAYGATREGTAWHTASDDGYLYDHLTYHLNALAEHDRDVAAELNALFTNDAWLHARVSADDYQYDGYLADVSLVWRRAHDQALAQNAAGNAPRAIATSVHYALIHTTVNALATNYEPQLIARLVETGVWSPARGVSVLRRVADARKQFKMALALIATRNLSKIQHTVVKRIGLAAGREMWREVRQANVAPALAWYLEGEARQQALPESLTTAREIRDVGYRAEVLAALGLQLEGDARQQALAESLAAARQIEDLGWRTRVLTALAPQLNGDLLAEALDAAREIGDLKRRTMVLAALAPQLEGGARKQILAEGLAAVREIRGRWGWAEALAALAPHLETETREQPLAEGLSAVREIRGEWRRKQALVALAPHLEGKLSAEELSAVRGKALWLSGGTFVDQAPHLEEERLASFVSTAYRAWEEEVRVDILTALGPYLEGELWAKGLAAAGRIRDIPSRVKVLAALAMQLWGEAPEQALSKWLAAAREIESERLQAEIVAALTLRLEGDRFRQAQAALIQCLWDFRDQERKDFLQLLADADSVFLRAFDLPPEGYARIAQSITEISTEWEWL